MHYSLGKRRIEGIIDSVDRGDYFPCHKTTGPRLALQEEHGGWDEVPALAKLKAVCKEQECVGARIWRNKRRYLQPGD